MDFLDPLYNRRHTIRLYTGYGLVAIAIFLAVTVLLLLAYGFQLSKNGEVIQNGLVFASSKPTGAKVYIDGINSNKQTNMRLNIPEGSYELELKRDGYRDWQHRITILGGHVVRYDYPLLIPETLNTTNIQTLAAKAPGIVTITPDNRLLLVQQDAGVPSFTVFDTKDMAKAPITLTVPTSAYTAGGKQTWQVEAWASDKQHALLRHGYGAKGQVEYVLFSRTAPEESINLNTRFKTTASKITFIDGKFDRYYLYSATDHTLRTAQLDNVATQPIFVKNALQYDTYGADTVLYVAPSADATTTSHAVELHIKKGDQDYVIRRLPQASSYPIAISAYSGTLYVAAADAHKQVVYVYKNPFSLLAAQQPPLAVATLRLAQPTYLAFSAGGRFVVAERGTEFATYDAEYKDHTHYHMPQPIDKGQAHAVWLDGAHLQYVSNKQLYMFDYDGTNAQLLVPAINGSQIFYDADYRYVFTVTAPANAKAKYVLTSTALRTAQDL